MAEEAPGRAMEPLTKEHLRKLGRIAARDQDDFFKRYPRYACDGLLCVALCQGGALHYVDGENGVKDLDVWVFYAYGSGPPFPPRRRGKQYYPDSGLTGWSERVDILARSINRRPSGPVESLTHYLRTRPTPSAWELARKAVVLIEPEDRIGEIVWPPGASA